MRNQISGWFKKEIFYNEENSYLIGKIQILNSNIDKKMLMANSTDGYITIVGYMPKLLKEEVYHFYGDFSRSNYGPQFNVESYEIEAKNDENSLIEFLSSDLFKGVGKKKAKKIVKVLGEDAIDLIIKDKEVLNQVSGLNENTKNNIYEVLLINYESEKVIRYLLKHGLGSKLSQRIFKKYMANTIKVIEDNPYRLIDEIEGIGFKRADQIASSIHYDLKSPNRIQAAIKFVFEEFCFNEGFTYITLDQLLKQSKVFLNQNSLTLSDEEIQNNIKNLLDAKKIILENDRYYIPSLHQAELTIANKIQSILIDDEEKEEENFDKLINEVEKEVGIKYTEKQIEAIEKALNSKVTVLTGGPGTGKTTVVNGIIRTYIKAQNLEKKDILGHLALIAPTGRAAKRMKETTSFDASTIHRFLGYQINGEFTYNEDNRLGHRLIIVDESSMIDVILCASLLKALKNDVKIVFVGDINQLPSVGPGEVLKDFIASQVITTVILEKIHRQSHNSSIITLAHEINQQIISSDLLEKQKDRNFIRSQNDAILENLQFIISNAISKEYAIDHIQVLAPMYKGVVGIDQINHTIQECVNPKNEEKKEIQHFNRTFRLGDKVIQLVNRMEDNVMNGDIGYIKHVFLEDEHDEDVRLIVDFDSIEVSYTEADLNELSLAYCISIHKSQGSEFDIVILVLSKSYSIMLRKKLIYTAVTRAKKSLIMIGDVEAYKIAVNNTRETIRQTSLKERLESLINKNDNDLSNTISKSRKVTIDDYEFTYTILDNLTPYDFLN